MSYSAFEGRNAPYGSIAPAGDCYPITPDDDADLPVPVRAVYIEVAGDLSVVTVSGAERVIPVTDFSILPVGLVRVLATGTTATGIFGLTQ